MKNLVAFFLQIIGLRSATPKHSQAAIGLGSIPGSSSSRQERQPVYPAEDNWDDGECCVCLSSMNGGGETRRLPCSHWFHRVCVDRWLSLPQKTCPLCRSYVEGGPVLNRKREELTEEMVIWFSSFHVAGF
ncbi:hypothetical protein ACLOJK_041811 [Asimina triloba]